jgi:hypothetical protein
MPPLPVRGPAARTLGLPLPPERMPLLRGTRPLKRWRYLGVFCAELMLCAGDARIGPLRQRWWAIATPDGALRQRTSARRGGLVLAPGRLSLDSGEVRIEIEIEEGEPVEVVSPSGHSYIWTRKQAGVAARGTVWIEGDERRLEGEAVVDESAGYHTRHTTWHWSAGVGRGASGARLAWNLVSGIHDAAEASERTIWVDGEPREVGPVSFAEDLSRIELSGGATLEFDEWCVREDHRNRLLLRSDYRQPFGTFRGGLPGGLRLAEGFGVMEEHDVLW